MEGVKHDQEKPKLGFLLKSFPNALIGAARQNDFGKKKYAAYNWKKVDRERFEDALLRHLLVVLVDPEAVDEESGYLHLHAVIWNSMCLAEHIVANLEFADKIDTKHLT